MTIEIDPNKTHPGANTTGASTTGTNTSTGGTSVPPTDSTTPGAKDPKTMTRHEMVNHLSSVLTNLKAHLGTGNPANLVTPMAKGLRDALALSMATIQAEQQNLACNAVITGVVVPMDTERQNAYDLAKFKVLEQELNQLEATNPNLAGTAAATPSASSAPTAGTGTTPAATAPATPIPSGATPVSLPSNISF